MGLCSGTHTTAKMSTPITICFEHTASFMTRVTHKVRIAIVSLRQIAGFLWLFKRSMTNLNEITTRRKRKISWSKAVRNETFASVNPKKWVGCLTVKFWRLWNCMETIYKRLSVTSLYEQIRLSKMTREFHQTGLDWVKSIGHIESRGISEIIEI